jgi:hypothetical protein
LEAKEAYDGARRRTNDAKADPVTSEETYVGARVRVRPGYRKQELWGALGTIEKRWGPPHYAAVEVRLDGGRSELLWRHELEEVREDTFTPLSWK